MSMRASPPTTPPTIAGMLLRLDEPSDTPDPTTILDGRGSELATMLDDAEGSPLSVRDGAASSPRAE